MALLLPPAAQVWPQYSQYPQNAPYNGQYAPNQQPGYAPPGYAQPQPYPQQPYAAPSYPGSDQRYPQPEYGQTQPAAQPFNAEQLQELLAPVALYPDTLLAQVLAAATYPAQVAVADQWLRGLQAQGYASPDQVAAGADAQSWDPSVKALTAFPQVLTQMDQNLGWTTDLGNAYYNQPQDVFQMVQVMRQRAQAAGTLENTPQEAVAYDQGNIELAPVNPQVVYVPAYNPWDVYGQPVSPYPGFSLLDSIESFAGAAPVRFGMGIAMAAFSHTSFGWMGWALDWLGKSVLFHHANYSSQSTTVARWGPQRGGLPGSAARAAMTRPPEGYSRAQIDQSPGSYARSGNGYNGYSGPRAGPGSSYPARPGNYVRPALQNYAYTRLPQRPQPDRMPAMPVRPQQSYARPGGGFGYYGEAGQAYAGRPGSVYGSPQQSWRAPAASAHRGDFGQRSYAAPMDRGFMGSTAKPEHSGGFHLFGGGRGAGHSYGGGKAPRSFSGWRHSGGGHSGGHHSGGHHR
jgi:hypothetical protein